MEGNKGTDNDYSIADNYIIDNPATPPVNTGANTESTTSDNTLELLTQDAAKDLGGISFNFKGELIDNTGAVLLSKESALEKIKNPPAKEANNPNEDATSEYFLDDNDNVVNAQGKLIAKKGAYTTNDKGEITLPTKAKIATIAQQYVEKGFSLKDEDGNDLSFDADDDVTHQRLTEVVSNQLAAAKFQKTLTALPEVKALMEHLTIGGNAKDFYKSRIEMPDYTNLAVADDDIAGRKAVLMDYYTRVSKLDTDTAEVMIGMAEDAGKAKELLTTAVNGLKQWQVQKVAAENVERESKVQQQEVAQKAHWSKIKSIVSAGKINDLVIPENERTKFFEYIAYDASENKSGTSKAALDYEALSLEDKMKIDYLIYKKFNFDDLVKSKVAQARANDLKLRKATVVAASVNPIHRKVTGGGADVNINNII